jgi:anti-sigma B factor antagonist
VSVYEFPTMAVEVVRDGQIAIVTVGGDLEFGTAAALRTTLIDLAHQAADPVVVDLAAIEFIDSTGLSLLVQAKQRFESQGRRFSLRRPPHRVMRVLETSGLAELFTIEPE